MCQLKMLHNVTDLSIFGVVQLFGGAIFLCLEV